MKSCVSAASAEETILVFTCDDSSVVQFTLNNHSEIPVGTFELTNDDECNYEGGFESIDLSGDLEAGFKKITSANHCPLRQCKSTLLDTEHTPF